jgi:hypothetical protein
MGITFQRIGPTKGDLNTKQRCETCGNEAELLVVSHSSGKGECHECNPREFLALWDAADAVIDDAYLIAEAEDALPQSGTI